MRTSRGSRSELLRQRQEVGSVCFIAEDSLLVFCKENTVLLQIKKHEGKNLCIWQSLREGFYHRWSRGCDVSCRWSVQMRHLLVNLGFLSFSPSLTHVEGRSCHPSSEVICSFPYKITLDHATERKRNWVKLIQPQGGGDPLPQLHFVHGVQRSTPWETMTMLPLFRTPRWHTDL